MTSRRKFIRNTALGLGAAGFYPSMTRAGGLASNTFPSKAELPLSMADYTFRHYDIPQSIEIMQRLDVHALSVKDFHMPLDSSQDKINSVLKQYENGGIHVYAVGVIYMKTKASVDQAFNYAKMAGVSLIIGVPEYELMDYTEQKVKEFNIRLAIHNHGPQDKLYPGPKEVYEKIKDRDARMGLCIDIGHSERAGEEPAAAVLKYGNRLFDMHIKDVTKAENDGQAIEAGRGVINFPALLRALRKVHYPGQCSIEFEKDEKDDVPGIAESLGYFKGVKNGTA